MNMYYRRAVSPVVFATLLGSIAALAQTSVAPPPRPADSGPSLQATMQFLQDKLSDIGKVTYTFSSHDSNTGQDRTDNFTNEVSQVRASQCRIDYHWDAEVVGADPIQGDYWISLHDTEDVVVEPMEKYQNELNASGGKSFMSITAVNPPMVALLVRRPHNVSNLFPFTDPSMADRVAKAFTHAIELCGGGNEEPF